MRFLPRYFLFVLLALGARARAHDFWIEPAQPWSPVGSILSLSLRVGDDFPGEAVTRDSERIERFVLTAAGGEKPPEKPEETPPEKPIVGRDGSDPAGLVRIDSPGIHVAGYRSRRSSVELDPRRFRSYLKDEGLDGVLALREKRGESETPGREVFSRCAKALIACGKGCGGEGHDRVLGFPLELVIERNPFDSVLGDDVPVTLLYDGKPLAGAQVKARRRPEKGAEKGAEKRESSRTATARTDAEGRVKLRFDRAGFWLVAAVHMVEAPKETEADWESFWASMTFTLPQRANLKG